MHSLLPTGDIESAHVGVMLPARDYCAGNCQYGAAFIASAYAELAGPTPERVRGEWAHGWHPPEHNVHPELVVGNSGLSYEHRKSRIFWVARKDQARFLNTSGYRRVSAIGLPIVYAAAPNVRREPGSLLVMPVHSLATTRHRWNFERYADLIWSIRHHFSRVVACVHPACFEKGYWAPAFIDRGIPVISGAHFKDKNSLSRMAALFSRFEFVTTNGFGSHLAYSAFFGAKPSIFGEVAPYNEEDFSEDGLYQNCPELLPLMLDFLREECLRANYGWLFGKPWSASLAAEWGSFQVGLSHKCSPWELRKVFFNRKQLIGNWAKRVFQI